MFRALLSLLIISVNILSINRINEYQFEVNPVKTVSKNGNESFETSLAVIIILNTAVLF